MKLKLKLDGNKIREVLLQNVEKIVLAVVVLIFLLMLYSSVTSAGRFNKTPAQLTDQVRRAEEEIKRTPSDSGVVVPDYVSQAKRSRVPIEEKPYANTVVWDAPLFPRRQLRVAPALYTAQQLRGSSGIGAFRTIPVLAANPVTPLRPGAKMPVAAPRVAAGGAETTGLRWIVVTALVPIEKQEAAYAEAFRQSPGYDPRNDVPIYLGYWVERVEVSNSGDAPDWKKATAFISVKKIREAEKKWETGKDVEIVAPKYLDKALVFPLGPLVNQAWDASVAHEPEIPIQRSGDAADRFGGTRGLVPAGIRNEGIRIDGMRNDMGIERFGRMPGPAGGERGRRETDAEGTPFGNDEPLPEKERPDAAATRIEELKAPAYKLLRFFDFDVEPGKQYVYRVRLGLQNPNYEQKAALLANPELGAKRFLETKWSEPSLPIAVLHDTRVLLVSVKPTRGGDPTAEILLTKWVLTKGVEVFKEFPPPAITRGQVLAFAEQTAKITSGAAPAVNQMPDVRGGERFPLGERLGGRQPAFFAPRSGGGGLLKVSFHGNTTVADLRGGERLPGRKRSELTSPGEMLILDLHGNLIVHNELNDKPTCEQITLSTTESATRNLDGFGRPGRDLDGDIPPRPGLDMLQPDRMQKKRGPR